MRLALRQIQHRYEKITSTAAPLPSEVREGLADIPALLAEVYELREEVVRLENLSTRYARKIDNLTWEQAGTNTEAEKTCRLCGVALPDHAPECQAVNLAVLKNP